MRLMVVVVAVLAAGCGGEGRCEFPPCQAPVPSCDADEDCFQSEFCDFQQNSCGMVAGDRGTCVRRPTTCTGEVQLACGCDGQTYASSCVAASMGVDVDNAGGCALPPDAFACGASACDRTTQVCLDTLTGGDSHFFRCESFPDMCKSNRTCACLARFGCGQCTESGGGFTLQCMLSPSPATSSEAAPRASTSASR